MRVGLTPALGIKLRRSSAFLLLASLVLLPGLLYGAWRMHLLYGVSWNGTAEKELAVYGTELEAAYGWNGNLRAIPIGVFRQGELVPVVYHLHGKDYLACHVRMPQGNRGWVACTDLDPSEGAWL